MEYNLIKIRVVAFLQDLKAILITAGLAALVSFLGSPELAQVINTHFGGTITGMLILSAVGGLLNHLRNVKIVNNPPIGGFGAKGEYPTLL